MTGALSSKFGIPLNLSLDLKLPLSVSEGKTRCHPLSFSSGYSPFPRMSSPSTDDKGEERPKGRILTHRINSFGRSSRSGCRTEGFPGTVEGQMDGHSTTQSHNHHFRPPFVRLHDDPELPFGPESEDWGSDYPIILFVIGRSCRTEKSLSLIFVSTDFM